MSLGLETEFSVSQEKHFPVPCSLLFGACTGRADTTFVEVPETLAGPMILARNRFLTGSNPLDFPRDIW